jgi:hypothetical protein
MANPAGESNAEVLRLDFDRRLMLQFRGSVVTSDAAQNHRARLLHGMRNRRSLNNKQSHLNVGLSFLI